MANNLSSNITQKVLRKFLPAFESSLVITKGVSRTIIGNGDFDPQSGDTVKVKRPHDYTTYTDPAGDLTSATVDPIIAGNAEAVVQDWRTVYTEWTRLEKALELDQLGKPGELNSILGPMAQRLATDTEKDFSSFISANAALAAGTYGTAADTWDDIAEFGAVLQANGVPMDKMWNTYVNPYTQRKLASNQRSLGAGGVAGKLVDTAHQRAMITSNFAGMDVFTSNTIPTYTTPVGADRAGTLTATPTATYLSVKDTMQQTLAVTAFQANLVVKAGEQVTVAGRYALDKSTRDPIIDDTGAKVLWTGTVTADVTLGASGEGNLVVSGAAIFESGGAYNTVETALTSADVITLLGAASTTYQPNLFWHPDAFGLAFVDIPKLATMDNSVVNVNGMSMRIALDGNLIANKEVLRVDILPAYACYNPFFAGKGFGS